MEKPDIVLTDFETGNISLANGTDLNNIFNFTINFDLLKDVLTTLSSLLTQILLYNNKLESQSTFLKEVRAEEITRVLSNYLRLSTVDEW